MEDIIRIARLGETSNLLLNRLKNKQLILNDFLKECAYWAVKDGFDNIRPKVYPQKPDKVIEYSQISPEKRRRLDWTYYRDFPEVLEWYRTKLWVDNQNDANLHWLKEILTYIPEKDTLTRKKIESMILEFKACLNQVDIKQERIEETFHAKEI